MAAAEGAPALAEWASVCAALLAGTVVLTVRKGGIHERGGGLFAPEHDRFLLLPTFEHQAAERLRVPLADAPPPPGMRLIPGRAEVVRVWRLTAAASLAAIAGELPFTQAECAARLAYRGEPLLHVLALRVVRFAAPLAIPDCPAYAGCRSWIGLRDVGQEPEGAPVLSAPELAARVAAIDRALAA